MNCTIRLDSEKYERGMLLKKAEYYSRDDSDGSAAIGSWFFIL
jgi:hypothetical protein